MTSYQHSFDNSFSDSLRRKRDETTDGYLKSVLDVYLDEAREFNKNNPSADDTDYSKLKENGGLNEWVMNLVEKKILPSMSKKELFVRRPQLLEIFPATKKTRVIVANQGLTRNGLNFTDEGHI